MDSPIYPALPSFLSLTLFTPSTSLPPFPYPTTLVILSSRQQHPIPPILVANTHHVWHPPCHPNLHPGHLHHYHHPHGFIPTTPILPNTATRSHPQDSTSHRPSGPPQPGRGRRSHFYHQGRDASSLLGLGRPPTSKPPPPSHSAPLSLWHQPPGRPCHRPTPPAGNTHMRRVARRPSPTVPRHGRLAVPCRGRDQGPPRDIPPHRRLHHAPPPHPPPLGGPSSRFGQTIAAAPVPENKRLPPMAIDRRVPGLCLLPARHTTTRIEAEPKTGDPDPDPDIRTPTQTGNAWPPANNPANPERRCRVCRRHSAHPDTGPGSIHPKRYAAHPRLLLPIGIPDA
ncbi:hypothetical protein BT67DRAFT_301242 [Trichocladium antarcticum]|uniref:Uncharacterized protein n=1 Tax=Trichocladium antarcticum TaxID=1450529 RepID=A0AAN6ZE95_9PEZI|nr:hypothetical protein BT67DRAFT_301242 [Trichocladium antarcticum]